MNKKENKKALENMREKVEDFLESDSPQATATKFVLCGIALGGVAFATAAAPNVLGALGQLRKYKQYKEYSDSTVRNATYRLQKKKFVRIKRYKNGKVVVQLTNTGKKRVKEFMEDYIQIQEQKQWDKKWRIVIFDVPTEKDRERVEFRRRIKSIGFYQVQKSVWAYPYPCEDELLALAAMLEIEDFIEILTVKRMLHEQELKEHFSLE
jgi:CRISPR-associated endonuclease Cas2